MTIKEDNKLVNLMNLVKDKFEKVQLKLKIPLLRKYAGVVVSEILYDKYIKELEDWDMLLSTRLCSVEIKCNCKSVTTFEESKV